MTLGQSSEQDPTFLQQRAEIWLFALNQYLGTVIHQYPGILSSPAFGIFLGDCKTFHTLAGQSEEWLSKSAFLNNTNELLRMLNSYGDETGNSQKY